MLDPYQLSNLILKHYSESNISLKISITVTADATFLGVFWLSHNNYLIPLMLKSAWIQFRKSLKLLLQVGILTGLNTNL